MRKADNLTTFMCRLSSNLGASSSWNPQGLSRPVMGLLYFALDYFQGNVLSNVLDSTQSVFAPYLTSILTIVQNRYLVNDSFTTNHDGLLCLDLNFFFDLMSYRTRSLILFIQDNQDSELTF